MKFPGWFKYMWWITIFVACGYLLYQRYGDISTGKANFADLFILVIWVALALVPLFQEISLPGISLKQQIEEIKKDVKQEFAAIRTTLSNTVDVRTQTNLYYPTPPPDTQLPALEEKIKIAVVEAIEKYGLQPTGDEKVQGILNVEDDVRFLFSARYALERELRRIWKERFGDEQDRRPQPIYKLVDGLTQAQLIEQNLGHLIREAYSVCSPAIHGEDISEAKVNFVKDVIPELLNVLRAI
jgi:hypothetical protein